METVTIDAEGILEEIDLNPEDEATEIAQAIAVLASTPKGDVPLMRGMGLEMEHIYSNSEVVPVQMEAELAAALDEYEPRAEVKSLSAEQLTEGWMKTRLEVNLNGG